MRYGTKEMNMAVPIHMLLVEDNPGDVDLTLESLDIEKLHLEVSHVDDGEKAMNFLHRRGSYTEAQRPDLIVLDLNLPKKDGRQVLEEIKASAELCTIPVAILTSSDAELDVVRSYQLGANCYVTKPLNLQAYQHIVRGIQEFWFTIARLPPE